MVLASPANQKETSTFSELLIHSKRMILMMMMVMMLMCIEARKDLDYRLNRIDWGFYHHQHSISTRVASTNNARKLGMWLINHRVIIRKEKVQFIKLETAYSRFIIKNQVPICLSLINHERGCQSTLECSRALDVLKLSKMCKAPLQPTSIFRADLITPVDI